MSTGTLARNLCYIHNLCPYWAQESPICMIRLSPPPPPPQKRGGFRNVKISSFSGFQFTLTVQFTWLTYQFYTYRHGNCPWKCKFPQQWNWLSVERKYVCWWKRNLVQKDRERRRKKGLERGSISEFFFRINSHAWFYVVSERDLIIYKAFRTFHILTSGQYLTQLAFPPILFSAYFDSAEGAAHLSAEGRARLARFDAILQFGQGDGPSPANGHHHVVSPSGTGNTTVCANFSSRWELTSQCHCWIQQYPLLALSARCPHMVWGCVCAFACV